MTMYTNKFFNTFNVLGHTTIAATVVKVTADRVAIIVLISKITTPTDWVHRFWLVWTLSVLCIPKSLLPMWVWIVQRFYCFAPIPYVVVCLIRRSGAQYIYSLSLISLETVDTQLFSSSCFRWIGILNFRICIHDELAPFNWISA